jgi:hypothetical protein
LRRKKEGGDEISRGMREKRGGRAKKSNKNIKNNIK